MRFDRFTKYLPRSVKLIWRNSDIRAPGIRYTRCRNALVLQNAIRKPTLPLRVPDNLISSRNTDERDPIISNDAEFVVCVSMRGASNETDADGATDHPLSRCLIDICII